MSRSMQNLTRMPAAAFDFDVVTDVPAKPAPKPEPIAAGPGRKAAARDPSAEAAD